MDSVFYKQIHLAIECLDEWSPTTPPKLSSARPWKMMIGSDDPASLWGPGIFSEKKKISNFGRVFFPSFAGHIPIPPTMTINQVAS